MLYLHVNTPESVVIRTLLAGVTRLTVQSRSNSDAFLPRVILEMEFEIRTLSPPRRSLALMTLAVTIGDAVTIEVVLFVALTLFPVMIRECSS